MSDKDPTLKIRLRLPDGAIHLGRDCHQVASEAVDDLYEVLDAKWGRPEPKWFDDGKGWGRVRLNEYERGVVSALSEHRDDDTNIGRLLRIIDRMVKP